ncbi:MAG TPA: guanylate kinase [Gemmatimonadales bacterium]|nr:guanylate kinase [Gemmatimonadales bacterium]
MTPPRPAGPPWRVVVLAAPSGGGKTTIANELRRRHPRVFGYSVSATTRKPRVGEKDGEAYHFLTREEFQRRVRAGEFLEWAEYAGELYGTLRAEVKRVLASERHVVLDIEVQGARQVRTVYPRPSSVSIFVIPPSPRVLIERLRKRRTESEKELGERLAIAVSEVEAARDDAVAGRLFDHVLVNDDLETAVNRVIEIVEHPEALKHRPTDAAGLLADFVRELERAADQLKQSAKRSM